MILNNMAYLFYFEFFPLSIGTLEEDVIIQYRKNRYNVRTYMIGRKFVSLNL